MNAKRIKIEQKFSKKKYNLCVCLFAIPTILIIVAIFLYGYNWFTQFLFLFILGVDIFIPVILPFVHNKKYFSEMQISHDFIFLIFKIQDKIVERIEIAKTDIASVKIDVDIKKEYYDQNNSCSVYLTLLIKLFNGEEITNCYKASNYKNSELLDKWAEEQIEKTKDKEKQKRIKEIIEKFNNTNIVPQWIESGNYSFIFDFITCEQSLPNCELNIKTCNPKIKKEIEHYKKYGKRIPLIQRLEPKDIFLFLLLTIFFVFIMAIIYLKILMNY